MWMWGKNTIFESKFDFLNANIFCREKKIFLGLKIVILVQNLLPRAKKKLQFGVKNSNLRRFGEQRFWLGQIMLI